MNDNPRMREAEEPSLPGFEPAKLARAPSAAKYLIALGAHPNKRPYGSHAAAFVRNLGFSDDEVETPDGRLLTAAEAAEEFGERWYLSTEFTGRERLTLAGKEELAKLKTED